MQANKLRQLRKEKKITLDELAARIGTSKQTIHRYENGIINNIPPEKIERLAAALGTSPSELMGWDQITPMKYKNTVPLSTKKLPLLGSISCGQPIYAEEEHESFASADMNLDADFCLRAVGDSMIGARIYDGDTVFIRSQDSVDNGEIAAVIINDEATLKRVYYYPEEGKLILSPENPRYAPLVFVGGELEQIKIIGKAVAFQSAVI
ncbi:MAG: helix-turn-helix domain-containing protein [Clostridia bacterium]|nr:helix-turn-helix domain-containing protein [Clostridia bacterium]